MDVKVFNGNFTLKILFLTRYGQLGASSRLRSHQFLPQLISAGIACVVSSLFDDDMLQYKYCHGKYKYFAVFIAYCRRIWALMHRYQFDAIWIEKETLPYMPTWLEKQLLRGIPYCMDFDDAIFHNYDQHPVALVRYLFGRKIDNMMATATLVVAGNEYLAARARQSGAPWVEVVPTVIDLERYLPRSQPALPKTQFVIGWIGSSSTTKYLQILAAPLAKLSEHFSLRFRVIGGGYLNLPGVEIEYLPWSESTEVSLLQGCDIGVMPLLDSPWERGKCGYKLIQYMACGLPVVASPVGVNCEIVRNGENGFLADADEVWVDALSKLMCDAGLRLKMGAAGRKMVEERYCVQRVAVRLIGLLQHAPTCSKASL